ncbi:DUF4856 domain-containing protein [Maribacter dokdonensis]|uniref:DUF4856 domain-containing protein n=1 Tax=Maribacter dokdonensis TaxID=320912 RepID=UPI001C09AAC5|nr:DUF4856 domain-containing protein [Maribacter dokdonensis]MBU2899718.1 DUF4856 domain-containing protein [Maribacter dokdonensis]
MKKNLLLLSSIASLLFISCSSDDDGLELCGDGDCEPTETTIDNPDSYTFTRDNESTVSFGGQTTRLKMGDEILSAFTDVTSTSEQILSMYAHEEGANDFEDADLNASDKSVRSKTAASADFFATNATDQAVIRADFDGWISAQVNEVFPNWEVAAAAGTAGQIADGSSTRYINAQGLEYNQAFNKGLIGALTIDQVVNNYLSTAVLDEGDNVADNDANVVVEGEVYTNMEHKWDEAYGYVYGLNADSANPNDDLGADSFLNKYIGRVEGDDDFAGIADEIFQAFKLGRAAIVAKQYDVRDAQAEIIREKLSEVIGIRAVYYLQQGKNSLGQETPDYGGAFHDLSEGYGFVYSLQFTRKPNSTEPYFTKEEVDAFLVDLMNDGENGLWDVEATTLDAISADIAARFNFTLEQASE